MGSGLATFAPTTQHPTLQCTNDTLFQLLDGIRYFLSAEMKIVFPITDVGIPGYRKSGRRPI